MKRKTAIDTIMIHCTDTPEGRDVSVAELDSWHKARNFEQCSNGHYAGYHLLVHPDGRYERIRPDSERGQHCPKMNMNNRAVAVCYVGGKGRDGKPCDTRTEAQKRTLLTLVRTLKGRYPNAQVLGHRDCDARACPCFDAKTEYRNI